MPFRTRRLTILLLNITAVDAHAQSPGDLRLAVSVSPTLFVRDWFKAVEVEARVADVVTTGLGAGTVMGMPSGPEVTAWTPRPRSGRCGSTSASDSDGGGQAAARQLPCPPWIDASSW